MLDWRVPGYRAISELLPRARPGRSVLAVHEASGLPVVLRYHVFDHGEDALAALRAGNRVLAGIGSSHVAALYEHIEVVLDGHFGVATAREYVEGASLRRIMRVARLPVPAALSVLRAGLLALGAAHARGLTHQAYTPENLLVDAAGTTRLADFATPARAEPGEPGEPDEPDEPDEPARRDVRSAFEVLVASITGRRSGGALPRRLRGLAEPAAAGDGCAVLESVEAAGAAGWGPQWQARGEQELARLVAKAR